MRIHPESDRLLTQKERVRFAGVLTLIALGALAFGAQACDLKPAPRQPTYSTAGGATPDETRAATFKIYTHVAYIAPEDADPTDDAPSESWTGTGWIGVSDAATTYIVTAGHVCETRTEVTMTPDPLEQLLTGAEPQTLKVDRVTYEIRSASGDEYTAERVLVDDDQHDLCVLKFAGGLGNPLPLATEDPAYAATGWYVGAPDGVWGGGLAGFFPMTFSGRAHPFRGTCDNDPTLKPLCDQDAEVFTGAATHGASGSAILVSGRVVGVLNLVDNDFPNVSAAVPWDEIASALNRARAADAPPAEL